MMTMMVNRKVLIAELRSNNLDLLNDIADAIDKIVDEYYPNIGD